jgi:altronate dehydratase
VNPLLVISARDNVATALEALDTGRVLTTGGVTVTLVEAIPAGHKVALVDIPAGDAIVKYGSAIGVASSPIRAGAHVHVHNVASARGRGDLARSTPAGGPRIAEPPDSAEMADSALRPVPSVEEPA